MKRKRILSLIVTLLVLFNVNLDVFASGAIEENTNVEQMNEKDAIIQQLFDDRATLLSEFDMIENESEEDKYTIALNEIDLRLAQLGVKFHTAEEVATQFPETKNNKELALLGKTAVAQPKATKPTSSVNTWASYRTTYTYEGVSYNIQRLVAQPKSDSSPLRDTGTRTVTHSKSWTAGAGKVITSLAESGIGSIPGATTYLTFYNAAKAFISGMSTTTEVKAPKIAYTWSSTTTAVFTYVRKSSQTDDYQWLSLISTKNKTVVGYDIPSFTYKAGSTWLMEPDVVQGKHTIESVPSGYDDNSVALAAYTTVSGGPIHRAVSFVKISGPESNTVQKISICYPNFPLHCE